MAKGVGGGGRGGRGGGISPEALKWAGSKAGFINGGRTYRIYHGTTADRLESIRQKGLTPPASVMASRWFMYTTGLKDAKGYADRPGGIVIEYQIPASQIRRFLWPGATSTGGQYHSPKAPIPAKYIKQVVSRPEGASWHR